MSIRPLPVLLHTVFASIMYWGYIQLDTLVTDEWIREQKGGHWQYLTIQALAAACLTMILGVFVDLFSSFIGFRKAQRVLLLMSLPVSIVVSSIYWTLLLLYPALILPPDPTLASEPSSSSAAPPLMRVPFRLDLALHASPAMALLIEFVVFQTPYSYNDVTYSATVLAVLVGIWYGAWVEYCASYNKAFPYPFLTDNPFHIRLGIYAGVTALALLLFRGMNALHPDRWKSHKH